MGLYHFYARTYSPSLRRWLQRDPLGYVDGVNLYGYVGGNPLRYVDPFGMAWWDPIWQALPPGFHNWAAGGGHIPVVDPGTAQDVVQTATEIAGGFAPIPAGKGRAAVAVARVGTRIKKIAATTKGANVARKASKTLRSLWEGVNKRKWPKDNKGKNQDVSHKKPLADGGTNDVDNIEPKPHDQHIQEHRDNGDFVRWGQRAKGD